MRKVLVVLNLSNFTGTANHCIKTANGGYEKLRVDYKEMLQYLVNDRELLGAYVISQQDVKSTRTAEQLTANQKFVQKLKDFGWTPVRIPYDSSSNDMTAVFDIIWQNVLSPFADERGELTINPATTDIVFVNGSASWFDLINSFFQLGFQAEVAYPKSAISSLLTANFAFLDLTQFLLQNNAKVKAKQIKE